MNSLGNFQKRYDQLNPQQKEAVDTIEGPVLVVAGPGAGKTELLSLRIANILRKTDTLASSILCLTFTEAAAHNMRKRLFGLIGKEAYKVAIHTFHSFGAEIISQNPEYFYQGAQFTAADQLTQIQILEGIFQNLKYNDPLNKYHPEQGFTYLKESLTRIADLKQAGITPEDLNKSLLNSQKFIKAATPIIADLFADRISAKNIASFSQALSELQALPDCELKEELLTSFSQALIEATAGQKTITKPLTAWKNQYTKKNREKNTILKDADRIEKLLSLQSIYTQYQEQLHTQAYYDFSDMLLDTLEGLKKNPELRYNLQEQYLYLLVDEFQDTNGVQMELLDQVLNSEINEGRPNILAVGDDDQSIFKFQGANIQNILGFHEKYLEPKIITLTQNYRSHQGILDFVRPIIIQGEERLENIIPEVNKELTAGNPKVQIGEVSEKVFHTELEELTWIAQQIQSSQTEKSQIAVIARHHRSLEQIAKVLDHYQVPVHYERKKNLFLERHISEVITILRFIAEPTQESYLASILTFPFWNLDRIKVWQLSSSARKKRKTWLSMMLEDDELKGIAEFLITLSQEAQEFTAEQIIDKITEGSYRQHYFQEVNQNYLEKLKAYQAFLGKVRQLQGETTFTVQSLLEYLDLHQKHGIPLSYHSEVKTADNAVQLLTSHGAKGLEFHTVFTVHCQEQIWCARARPQLLSFTSNLKITADKDTSDDQLRLFYVALTRAKSQLYLTRHQSNQDGREFTRLRFLQSEEPPAQEVLSDKDLTLSILPILHNEPINTDEKELLRSLVKDYKLSVTHFNNFLNLLYHGPQAFLQNQILRFPQMMAPAAAYGSAVHDALHYLQVNLKRNQKLISLQQLLDDFKKSLIQHRLNHRDLKQYFEQGKDHLTHFYQQRKDQFSAADLSEFDFRDQGVLVGQAQLTGKIDRIALDPQSKNAHVYDYKTGKALYGWDKGRSQSEHMKAWTYKNQLIFYKLLVENSRKFKGQYKVQQGTLEFIAPVGDQIKSLILNITPEEAAQTADLINIVYNKITNLDFPDTSKYSQDFAGTQHFCADLLGGLV